jgi:hypothetical protein
MQPTIILKFSHSDAIAFEGKAAADFIKLLDQATLVHHEYFSSDGYQWVPADPDTHMKPDVDVLVTGIMASTESRTIRQELRDAQKKLFELFPYGYVKQACKIAGMRRPRAWSTG